MILLLGGTHETAALASALAEAGQQVLVSLATDVSLDLGSDPRVRCRRGPLDEDGMATLIVEQAVRHVVDATHPFASLVKRTAQVVAGRCGIPYLALVRPPLRITGPRVRHVADHAEGARAAVELGRAVLLTIGSRNVGTYVQAARERRVPLVARVLAHPASIAECRRAGLGDDELIVGRGPFSVEQNRDAIRRFSIGVLVTKESGAVGGVEAKVEAVEEDGIQLVVVDRPPDPGSSFASIPEVVRAVGAAASGTGEGA